MKIKIALTDGVTAIHEGNYKNLDDFIEKIETAQIKTGSRFVTLVGMNDKSEVALNMEKIVTMELIK